MCWNLIFLLAFFHVLNTALFLQYPCLLYFHSRTSDSCFEQYDSDFDVSFVGLLQCDKCTWHWNHLIIPPNSCGAICLLLHIVICNVCILCKGILLVMSFHLLCIWAVHLRKDAIINSETIQRFDFNNHNISGNSHNPASIVLQEVKQHYCIPDVP